PAALKESPYRPLGAGRWTTPELFSRLNREVPQGSPMTQVRSSVPLWTKGDKKDLAGHDGKTMPAEARRALEELGIVERPPAPDESPWRPPKDALRLPALNDHHITQAYFPVGLVLRAFAPDVEMVFVQFISGDHQPFLLDREHGLLKAVHPEELRARILKEGIPAGTHLWLEYGGHGQYRIAPRPLPFKRMVPCKLAQLANRRLHIDHIQISMMYEGDPFLFKTNANVHFEEIEALFAEAGRVGLSVRDALIYGMQELCAADPDRRAHRSDLFNAVFLQRLCSPEAVSIVLYTQPCFEQLAGGYFRYKPLPEAPVRPPRKTKDRLFKLWDHLLSDLVAPDPLAEELTTLGGLEGRSPGFLTFIPEPERPPHLSRPEPSPLPAEEATAESEAFPDLPLEAAGPESGSFSSPFRWDPKPAWAAVPSESKPRFPRADNTGTRVYVSKIPFRPLHRQPIHRRIFFYLQSWLSRMFGKIV
ncbi:MAG TPA: hypothetical protein VFO91_01800, partial [Anaerolineales bacterium]|nr:hypothetical protein [Anaerolineales bacterium]